MMINTMDHAYVQVCVYTCVHVCNYTPLTQAIVLYIASVPLELIEINA